MTLGNNLRYYRRSKGFDLTQKELADKVGVSQMNIVMIEKGNLPNLKTAHKIAQFFGVSVEQIFFE